MQPNWLNLKKGLTKQNERKRKRAEERAQSRKRLKRNHADAFLRTSKKGKDGLHRKSGKPTAVLAEDFEFVGVGPQRKDFLARASVVNYHGEVIYDVYVKPDQKVTDYRFRITGISEKHLRKGRSLKEVQEHL